MSVDRKALAAALDGVHQALSAERDGIIQLQLAVRTLYNVNFERADKVSKLRSRLGHVSQPSDSEIDTRLASFRGGAAERAVEGAYAEFMAAVENLPVDRRVAALAVLDVLLKP